jgi:predicted transposase YdaD
VERKEWDRIMKMLMQANPQDLVSWVLTDAVYEGELSLELQKEPPILADLLYTIRWRGEPFVLHVEFQRGQDDDMGRRVWKYNCSASIHTGLTAYSVVVYLLEKECPSIVESPYERKVPTGLAVHHFVFENIKMWEIPPEVLKEQKLPGLLPLLPLTKGGKSREVVEEMIEGLEQAGRFDLLPLGYVFSAYKFDEEKELQWLKERFKKMQGMLEDNWAYREMVQWAEEKGVKRGLEQGVKQGLEQGLEQGVKQELQALRTTLLRFVETHFPDQLSLAKQQVALMATPSQVQAMLDKLFVARTNDDVGRMLLAIPR